MIDAVLFDLDGTLADTAPDMSRTVNEMCRRRRLPPVPEAKIRPHVSKGARGMIGAAFGILPNDPGYAGMRDEFLEIYADHLCIDTRLFPGMDELLGWLQAEGIAWGVVTNKFKRFADPILEALGVASRASVVVGGDTCARAKPFPDPLVHAADRLGVEASRALYVGDDERDVQAARAAGMPVLVAGYGYTGDGSPPTLWGADGVITAPAGVKLWIRERSSRTAA
jgi:phosphoglycolate phosphatase